MRIISAYNLCKNKTVNSGTTYQQQLHHAEKGPHLSTNIIWRNLIKQIKSWRELGDNLILLIDHNKHITNGPLGKQLRDRNGLDLREAIVQHTGTSPGNFLPRI